ncbi:MAG TPA: dihydroneopterin aldolase family protein [Thermoplasmata archaeon]|nr:dihydroneopterin aldolase family protein [Thermoplasmata archaeon]
MTRRTPPSASDRPALSARETLLFEAGIKLGGVFHQYLGMPVSAETAPGLARTIERAIGLQPYVARVRVGIDPAAGGPLGRGRFGYRYLSPPMLDVTVELADRGTRVVARLAHEPALRYPLMRVEAVRPAAARATGARRSARSGGRSRRRTSRSAG